MTPTQTVEKIHALLTDLLRSPRIWRSPEERAQMVAQATGALALLLEDGIRGGVEDYFTPPPDAWLPTIGSFPLPYRLVITRFSPADDVALQMAAYYEDPHTHEARSVRVSISHLLAQQMPAALPEAKRRLRAQIEGAIRHNTYRQPLLLATIDRTLPAANAPEDADAPRDV